MIFFTKLFNDIKKFFSDIKESFIDLQNTENSDRPDDDYEDDNDMVSSMHTPYVITN